ncbi:MAG: PKD domain-containing protein [Sphingobacteriales bacterium]|nr:MAG: PKD domain-containing protein [Sphingobacteriales bacterium]
MLSMKSILLILFLLLGSTVAKAAHITGGEMIYDYIGPGAAPNSKTYRITLKLFRDDNCFNCAAMPTSVIIGVFNNATRQSLDFRLVNLSNAEGLPLNTLPSCITNPPTLSYTVGYYSYVIELPDNAQGYTASYQTCCRISDIRNVPNQVGATYTTEIPGTDAVGSNGDNSPRFAQGISVVCYNKPFTLDFSATDPDGNRLEYSLCNGYDGGPVRNANPVNPSPPPYSTIGYINGFSGAEPLGNQATINTQTGIISGIAPDAGKYVVSVCVSSYDRNTGQFIATHRKDFIITVAPCDFAGAQLLPSYISCDGSTFTFENLNTSPLNVSFLWDFGDGNTSTQQSPTHTYLVPGVYTLKLVVNPGGSCSDSTTSQLSVFPGFFPAIGDNAPMCKGLPVQFSDLTTLNHGNVNFWKWDFGLSTASNDTSRIKNPSFSYATPGSYDVSLIVGSDRGCRDTINKTIEIIDRPAFKVSNDTLICSIDTLQLSAVASGNGSIAWSPAYMINNVNSFTPLVSPDVTTTYTAIYTDAFGCVARDTVTVNVVDRVTLFAGADTTICLTDTIRFSPTSDALQYSWSPAVTLNDANIKNPTAVPTATNTVYTVIGRIGKCSAQDQIAVFAVPYPQANAGPDTTICLGNSVQLRASGGSIYTWSPTRFLSNPSIANPVSQAPRSDIRYVVEVRDTRGCPKAVFDTVLVTVARIDANAGPRDTNIVLGQPLQLNATGSTNYSWTPTAFLSNPRIANPVATPTEDIEYIVNVSNAQGCFDLDSIRVKVFKTDPDLLVPTGFSPNKDGNNELFRPIPVGMKSLDAFRVYNRWGQLVFSTNVIGAGWDGKINGQDQPPGTFVWYAEGTNYLGRTIEKKGTVILIR